MTGIIKGRFDQASDVRPFADGKGHLSICLLYTSPSPRD